MTDDLEKAKNLFFQGNTQLKEEQFSEAEQSFKETLLIAPNRPSVLINLARAQIFLQKFEEAKSNLQLALSQEDKNIQGWVNLGLIDSHQLKHEQALLNFTKALQLDSNNYEALTLGSFSALSVKKYSQALAYVDQSLKLFDGNSSAWDLKGTVLHQLNRHEEALQCYDRAIQIDQTKPSYWYNKGNTLRQLGSFDDALKHFNSAILLKDDYLEAYLNKGNLLHHTKSFDEAIATLNQVIAIKSDYVDAFVMRAVIFNDMRKYEEAIVDYQHALEINSHYSEVLLNLGNTYSQLNQFLEAKEVYELASQQNPELDYLAGTLFFVKIKMCDWSHYEDRKNQLAQKIRAGKKCTLPFPLVAIFNEEQIITSAGKIYCQERHPLIKNDISFEPKKLGKIRIGYYSADFHNHATSYLMAHLFELHNRDNFEIIAFSFGPDFNDESRSRLKNAFDQFIDIRHLSDQKVAQISREMGIDIAVDLKGHTQDARTSIFANRAAPIQINYLGYPASMGVDYIDYVVVDKELIDKNNVDAFAEKIIYLPNSYQVNDQHRKVSNKVFTKAECGLPESGFVFCCFNNNYKITPVVFDSWMRILKEVENSVLWLFEDNQWVKNNLIQEAIKRGIAGHRLVFAKKMDIPEHLARHQLANLFLDTVPCNAHTTASDALWMDLPLLTIKGDTFSGRVAASLLNAIGLPELITHNLDEYETLAIELAKDSEKLTRLKSKLEHSRINSSLFDTKQYAKNLESAYVMIYDRHTAELSPTSFEI